MNTIKMQLAHNQHVDKRLQETQNRLIAALKRCYLAKQEFSTIHVTRLCQEAHVARQTFYRHYGSISEIIEVSCVRMINQFLQQVDRTPDSTRISARLIVTTLLNHRSLLEIMFWGGAAEKAILLITGDILRVYNFQNIRESHTPFIAEMMARSIISFAQVMLKNPPINEKDLVALYTRLVLAPTTMFKDIE
ncbi:TetR/AcrR family transcriptional regulator [Loigolactobacillus iwatensis]|uniref:TetR/AcrR family transcriptional regulator n=1 Tax=Loigolactobacillus iwatensis TaxID=1267156 RepID=UPI000F7ED580|nr:TetR/AcrR family transcriptional regulator [Loigolactobacillus iwatensis]